MPVSLNPAVVFAERGAQSLEFGGKGRNKAPEIVIC